jgi:O-antigen ligase
MTLLLASIVLFLGWIAPGHFLPWISFQNEVAAGAGGLLLAAFAAVVAKREHGASWPLPAVVAVALVLVVGVQLAAGQVRFLADAALAMTYVGALAVAVVTGATLTLSKQRSAFTTSLFAVLLAAGIASVGLGATQWLEIGPIGYIEMIRPGDRPGANLIQANHLATLLCLALVSAWWFFETRRIGGMTLVLVAAWLALGLVMTRSRTPWVFLALAGVLWPCIRRRVEVRLSSTAVWSTLGLFLIGVIAWGPISQAAAVGVPVGVADRIQSGSSRLMMWQTVLAGLAESPWVGYGWTQVSRAALEGSLTRYSGEHMLRNSHNVLVDLLAWNGIPLGGLLIILGAWWLFRSVRACRDIGHLTPLLALCAILIHALLEYPLEYMYFLIPAGLLVGQLDALQPVLRWRAPWLTLALPVAMLTGMLGWISTEYLRVHAASDANLMVQAGYARSASLPEVVLLDASREYIRFWNVRAEPGMSDVQLRWMADVVGRFPSPPALLRFAMANGLNGRPNDARDTLIRLCNMHKAPRCDEGRRSWATAQEQYPVLRPIAFPATPRP